MAEGAKFRIMYHPSKGFDWFVCDFPGQEGVGKGLTADLPVVLLKMENVEITAAAEPAADARSARMEHHRHMFPFLGSKPFWDRWCADVLTNLYSGFIIVERTDASITVAKPKRKAPYSDGLLPPAGFISREDADKIIREVQEAAQVAIPSSTDHPNLVEAARVRSVLKDVERVIVKYLWTVK